ncbi:hypothetical protein [Neorhizobium sp. NCHU2750]|uniref:hypothetical protein n=1 Tax=Neorhizobium sp. NCHU2750 TaxID=1825976 RepID=UPI000EB61264|nr:hypothetical protein NCHU2750_49160 [Neorhizobium sp. NCHU2750]
METTKRRLLIGSATATVMASSFAKVAMAGLPLDLKEDSSAKKILVRMIRVMFPHKNFADGPYARTADAVFKAAAKTPADKIAFLASLRELQDDGFMDLDDKAAYAKLKSIDTTDFFKLVKGTTVTTLYDDPEVWKVLGYEGPSFDKGGYIHRGFNDLDWLPDPRIDEYAGAGQ